MNTLDEIKSAVSRLSFEQRAEFARWFHGWTDDEWDRQMARDVESGRWDAVIREVEDEMSTNRLRDLP